MRGGPLICAALALAAGVVPAAAVGARGGGDPLVDAGRELFLEGCSSCHGADGSGAATDDGEIRGPSLLASGEASAYYELSTGRMPLADSEDQPQRKEPAYDDDEIDALVAFVGSLGDGPGLPELSSSVPIDLPVGNDLFRDNCQACHSASGGGGALSYGRAAPPLSPAHGLQIAAAMRAGPGQMPVFGPEILTDEELTQVVAYVEYLDDPADPGGLPIGRLGPIPEGFVAWFIGMTALLGLVVWIGTYAPVRRVGHGPVDEEGAP